MSYVKLKSEGQKRIALEWQLRYHKSVLKLGEIFYAEQKGLLKLTNISVQQMKKNLIDILNISPHVSTNLQDLDEETIRLTSTMILSAEECQEIFENWVRILAECLNKQREKITKEQTDITNETQVEQDNKDIVTGEKRPHKTLNAKAKRKILKSGRPDPSFLIGKRVKHLFWISEQGSKRKKKSIYTGTILKIVKPSKDPLFTLYQIRYDVDNNDGDDDDEESDNEVVQTDWNYELLIDYMNGDLSILDE